MKAEKNPCLFLFYLQLSSPNVQGLCWILASSAAWGAAVGISQTFIDVWRSEVLLAVGNRWCGLITISGTRCTPSSLNCIIAYWWPVLPVRKVYCCGSRSCCQREDVSYLDTHIMPASMPGVGFFYPLLELVQSEACLPKGGLMNQKPWSKWSFWCLSDIAAAFLWVLRMSMATPQDEILCVGPWWRLRIYMSALAICLVVIQCFKITCCPFFSYQLKSSLRQQGWTSPCPHLWKLQWDLFLVYEQGLLLLLFITEKKKRFSLVENLGTQVTFPLPPLKIHLI